VIDKNRMCLVGYETRWYKKHKLRTPQSEGLRWWRVIVQVKMELNQYRII